jgi:hypothetical protein
MGRKPTLALGFCAPLAILSNVGSEFNSAGD